MEGEANLAKMAPPVVVFCEKYKNKSIVHTFVLPKDSNHIFMQRPVHTSFGWVVSGQVKNEA